MTVAGRLGDLRYFLDDAVRAYAHYEVIADFSVTSPHPIYPQWLSV